jgi:hypothetical protein
MSSTVSDSDSDAGLAIPPTTFASDSDIDITAQPAVITWRNSDGEDQRLSCMNLDLHYDARSSKAFFKLRAAVALKSHPRSRNTPVFLFIHPERVCALVFDDSPCAVEAKALGTETVGLHFKLSRSPALVVPKEPLAPRNQTSGNLLDSLRAVAQQTTFSVYAKIPCRRLPRQRLLGLCGAVSRNEVGSITAHSNASSLYAGAGGTIIEGGSLARPGSTAVSEEHETTTLPQAENPPSYDEVPPGPPLATAGSHKRRRLSTPEAESVPLKRLDRKYIEDICAQMIDNRLGQLRRDVTKQLQDLENRVIDYVDEQLIVQRQEATEELGRQTEDEYYGLKINLQDYVREEIEEAEGRILDHLSTASFSLQLNP